MNMTTTATAKSCADAAEGSKPPPSPFGADYIEDYVTFTANILEAINLIMEPDEQLDISDRARGGLHAVLGSCVAALARARDLHMAQKGEAYDRGVREGVEGALEEIARVDDDLARRAAEILSSLRVVAPRKAARGAAA